MAHKTFHEMIKTLKSHAACGMHSTITLKPDDALALAKFFEDYEYLLKENVILRSEILEQSTFCWLERAICNPIKRLLG